MRKNILSIIAALCFFSCNRKPIQVDQMVQEEITISPDYSHVTLPINIAPINFEIKKKGDAYQASFGYDDQISFVCNSQDGIIKISPKKWRNLLHEAAGKNIFIRIAVEQDGLWKGYPDIKNYISKDSIDGYLAYRLLYPGYELWNEMGIYQRDLSNYKQTPIMENLDFNKQCINCHTFANHSPESMLMHVRGESGGILIHQKGHTKKVNAKLKGASMGAAYSAWNPNERHIAFSTNEIQQFFHSKGTKAVEVADLAADMIVYDSKTETTIIDSTICTKEYMETFPNWAPDGKRLYFCRGNAYAEGVPLDSIRYDLYAIDFDPETGKFENLNCIFNASAKRKSVSFPRVSPDGKHLMFTLSDYGNFSIWHPESDLYTVHLATGKIAPLSEVNSPDVESFHTWSSTGKWFVFSSKRIDGLWARPYFAYFDTNTGKASKPFLLPQEDPKFYDTFMMTYNLPELITSPVEVQDDLLKTQNGL